MLRLHSVLVNGMAEGICLVRIADQTIVYTNPKFDRMLGYDPGELLGSPAGAIRFENDAQCRSYGLEATIDEELSDGGEASYEVRTVKKDGTRIWCRTHVSRLEHAELGAVWVTLCEDITERRQLQARLLVSDRMASLGTLAAGITHEINNPLAYVISNLEMMAEEIGILAEGAAPERLSELREMLHDARAGAERVRSIVGGLATFSHPEKERRRPLDVRTVLTRSMALTRRQTHRRAHVTWHYEDVPLVEADEGQLGHVFINLLLNSAQSIAAGTVQQNEIRVVADTDGAGRVAIEVSDTGTGIAPEMLACIFDPFFTTKAVGDGPGLGLSICHSIVTSLGGHIDVQSSVGKGSTFRIVLPAARSGSLAQEESTPPQLAPQLVANQPPTTCGPRRGSVLVVDDDAMVAGTIRRIFEREHDVALATNGRAALELLRSEVLFDAIVCDLMMPVMTGMDLFDELARKMPEVCGRMVFITGGAFTPAARAFLDRIPNPRVDKPFAPQTLRSLVHELVETGKLARR